MSKKKQNKFSAKDSTTKASVKKKKQFLQEAHDSTKNRVTEKVSQSKIGNTGVFKKKNKIIPMKREMPNENKNNKGLDNMPFKKNIKIKNNFSNVGNPPFSVKQKMPSETSQIEKNCEIKNNLKKSKFKQNSQLEVNFPRGKKGKIFKDELSSSFEKKKESIVNIFDQSTMPQHHEEITHEKKSKNKFNPISEQRDKLDKKSIKKKRNRNPKQKRFQQFPDRFSMEKARLGLNSMLTKTKDSFVDDSEKNVDQIASDFKKLVQKKLVSKDNALKFKKLQQNKKISDQIEMLKKLTKKQRILLKKSGKKFDSNNVENQVSLVHNKKFSKKLKKKLESTENSRTNELYSDSKNDSNKDPFYINNIVPSKKISKKLKKKLESTDNSRTSEFDFDSQNDDSNKGNIKCTGYISFSKPHKTNKKFENNKLSDNGGFENRDETEEKLTRTLFVGNLPLHVDRSALKKLFSPYGSVESTRIRCSVPEKSSISKKITNITKKYNSNIYSLKGYVVFKTVEGAKCGLALNGSVVDSHHIRVDFLKTQKFDDERSIFIGNLPFDVDDESLWTKFSDVCGEIESVRVIRDQETGVGKGFGYIVFRESMSVDTAIKMDNLIEIEGRQVRVKPVDYGKQNKKLSKKTKRINTFKAAAIRDKKKMEGSCRKSIKKLTKRRQLQHQKKKISSLFANKKTVKMGK